MQTINVKPINLANGTLFNFKEYHVSVTAQRVRADGNGNIIGEVDIETTAPARNPDIYFGKYNFLSMETRQRLANWLDKKHDGVPWPDILEFVSRQIVRNVRRGESFVEVSSSKELSPIQFDVFPLIQTGQPTTLFGDGATGKSYLALILSIAMRLPWVDNPLGLNVSIDTGKDIVWLDYETSEDDFQRRLRKIVRGMNLGEVTITYRRCSQVLADEIDELSSLVSMREPGLTVIDSIGAACAGDLHGSESPTRFFNAIRRFPGSKILLFHTNREKELYGNRFFWNFSRHVWEVRKQQVEEDNIVSVGLYHRKANETRLFSPLAINLIFSDDDVLVERANIADIPELAEKLSLTSKLKMALMYGKRGEVSELAEELNESESSVRARLNDKRNKNIFKHFDDGWGLLTDEEF